MTKLYRKIQKANRNSAMTISLPKDVAEMLDLEKGEKLAIDVDEKNRIIMTPIPASKHEIGAAATK